MSSDFGPMILRGIDHQIGLIERLANAFDDRRHPSYTDHPLGTLFAQRIFLDMDHSEDATYGHQQLSFYNHHYRSHCYLPLFLFEGISGKLITAVLRPGKRPKGAENAIILKRVLKHLRAAWPETRIVLRGDGHFSNPELMQLALADPHTDFIFGLTGNNVLARLARPFLAENRIRHELRKVAEILYLARPPHPLLS
jgi:hypothetical protein